MTPTQNSLQDPEQVPYASGTPLALSKNGIFLLPTLSQREYGREPYLTMVGHTVVRAEGGQGQSWKENLQPFSKHMLFMHMLWPGSDCPHLHSCSFTQDMGLDKVKCAR